LEGIHVKQTLQPPLSDAGVSFFALNFSPSRPILLLILLSPSKVAFYGFDLIRLLHFSSPLILFGTLLPKLSPIKTRRSYPPSYHHMAIDLSFFARVVIICYSVRMLSFPLVLDFDEYSVSSFSLSFFSLVPIPSFPTKNSLILPHQTGLSEDAP